MKKTASSAVGSPHDANPALPALLGTLRAKIRLNLAEESGSIYGTELELESLKGNSGSTQKEKQGMKEVIPSSAAVRLALSGSRYVDVAAMPWSEPVPGLRMKVLYKDDQAREAMVLVEAGPGAVALLSRSMCMAALNGR